MSIVFARRGGAGELYGRPLFDTVVIPPDPLFDALAKIASATLPSEISADAKSSIHDFAEVHQADWSAAEFGGLLDAGLIQGK